jgi:hypothetical protein
LKELFGERSCVKKTVFEFFGKKKKEVNNEVIKFVTKQSPPGILNEPITNIEKNIVLVRL